LRKNYYYNLLLTVSNLLIPLLSFPYAARVLGPTGIGQAQFIFLVGQYLSIIAALGIPIYGAREVARLRNDPAALSQLLRALLVVNGVAGVLIFGVFCIWVLSTPALGASQQLYLVGGLLILLSFTSVEWVYTGLEAFRKLALRSVLIKLLSLMGLFLLVHSAADLSRYLLLQIGTLIAYNLLNFRGVLRHLNPGSGALRIRPHLRPLLLIFGTTLASTLYTTFDSILLGLLASDQAVGYYTAATKVAKIALPLVMAYGATLLPAITATVRDQDSSALQVHIQNSYDYIIAISVPMSVGLFAFARPLIELFSGAAFAPAILTLQLLSPMPVLIGLGYFWGYQVVLPMGEEKILLLAAVFGVLVSLAANFSLVPLMQQHGAAVAGIAAELVVTITYYWGGRRYIRLPEGYRRLAETVLAAMPFLGVVLLPEPFWATNTVVKLVLLGGSSILLYSSLQLFVFRNPAWQAVWSRILSVFKRFSS
jgi:O-antigen/teichoic acid export membrane protein